MVQSIFVCQTNEIQKHIEGMNKVERLNASRPTLRMASRAFMLGQGLNQTKANQGLIKGAILQPTKGFNQIVFTKQNSKTCLALGVLLAMGMPNQWHKATGRLQSWFNNARCWYGESGHQHTPWRMLTHAHACVCLCACVHVCSFTLLGFQKSQIRGTEMIRPLKFGPRPNGIMNLMRMRSASSEFRSLRAGMIEGEKIPCHYRDRDRDLAWERCRRSR